MNNKKKVTIFYCINCFSENTGVSLAAFDGCEIKTVKMACSSMVKDIFLLRAFEAGADEVIIMACPEGACRYVEGNIRAKKRCDRVKNLLGEIGMDGNRLSMCNTRTEDGGAAVHIIKNVLHNTDAVEYAAAACG